MNPLFHHFAGKFEISGECIIYLGRKDKGGYGMYGNGANVVHRYVYEKCVGAIPPGMTVDHICFNRACCRPKHLRLLTRSENARNQRRTFNTSCGNGHPYDETNTGYRKGFAAGTLQRYCKACLKAHQLKNRDKYNLASKQKYHRNKAK